MLIAAPAGIANNNSAESTIYHMTAWLTRGLRVNNTGSPAALSRMGIGGNEPVSVFYVYRNTPSTLQSGAGAFQLLVWIPLQAIAINPLCA